ncbi:MAG: alpha-ribazole phosphatase [Desulfuromonadales bacterium]|nr:alpha-ribazole phosphatase [Desulfuromonadales bacterium]
MIKKTRVYLIRHGEVEGAGVPRYNGYADVALTEHGVQQYHDLKPRFAGADIKACYSSSLTRCVVGAKILSEHLGVVPTFRHELKELNIGVWERMTWSEIMERYPAEWEARKADLVNYRVPEGENLIDLANRVIPTVNEIVNKHVDEEVLIVAHGGVNRIILLDAIAAPLSSMFHIEQQYACLNIIDYFEDGKRVVKLLNG